MKNILISTVFFMTTTFGNLTWAQQNFADSSNIKLLLESSKPKINQEDEKMLSTMKIMLQQLSDNIEELQIEYSPESDIGLQLQRASKLGQWLGYGSVVGAAVLAAYAEESYTRSKHKAPLYKASAALALVGVLAAGIGKAYLYYANPNEDDHLKMKAEIEKMRGSLESMREFCQASSSNLVQICSQIKTLEDDMTAFEKTGKIEWYRKIATKIASISDHIVLFVLTPLLYAMKYNGIEGGGAAIGILFIQGMTVLMTTAITTLSIVDSSKRAEMMKSLTELNSKTKVLIQKIDQLLNVNAAEIKVP